MAGKIEFHMKYNFGYILTKFMLSPIILNHEQKKNEYDGKIWIDEWKKVVENDTF